MRLSRQQGIFAGCLCLLLIHVILLTNLAVKWGPTPDENAIIASGVVAWRYGNFDLYCVNTPVVKLVAGLPTALSSLNDEWADLNYEIQDRPEFRIGDELVQSHPDRWRKFLVQGRLALIPFSVLGALIVFFWSRELFGTTSGFVAMALWCFSPDILGWSAVICSDGLAATGSVLAGYSFWRWMKYRQWSHCVVAGILFGVAQLMKMSLVILFPLMIVLWLFVTWSRRHSENRLATATSVGQLFSFLCMAVFVMNLGYCFDKSFQPLGDFTFFSETLAGKDDTAIHERTGANRFRDTIPGMIPVPLPVDYVRGADIQKVDFEEGQRSYLMGTWQEGGWWYYYLIGFMVKTPVGTIALAFLVLLASMFSGKSVVRLDANRARPSTIDYLCLLMPAALLLILVSSQSGFSANYRYVLPALPFLFIWISQAGRFLTRKTPLLRILSVTFLATTVMGTVYVYPHVNSFFNFAAGGPRKGPEWMLDSSFSWGQDAGYLAEWTRENLRKDEIPFISVFTRIPSRRFGMRTRGAPPAYLQHRTGFPQVPEEQLMGPVPGIHCVGVQLLHDPESGYQYFRKVEPVARIGYSINIYRLDQEQVSQLRRELELPPWVQSSHQSIVPDIPDHPEVLPQNTIPVRIGVYATDPNSGELSSGTIPQEVIQMLEQARPMIDWEPVAGDEFTRERLGQLDVVMFPGGNSNMQADALGIGGRRAVRKFVAEGGGFIGICAGAFLAASRYDNELGLVNVRYPVSSRYVPYYGNQLTLNFGDGEVQLALTDGGRSLLGINEKMTTVDFGGGPVFGPGRRTYLPKYEVLATYQTGVHKWDFQRGMMEGTPAILGAHYGRGKVLLYGVHPETSDSLVSGFADVCRKIFGKSNQVRDDH